MLQALEGDNATHREELAAVSDDLKALVQENQVIVSQLTGAAPALKPAITQSTRGSFVIVMTVGYLLRHNDDC